MRERKRSENLAQAPILTYARAESTVWLSGCSTAQARSSETQAETRPSPPERAERLQARVSNSMAWYSQPPGRNESLQREAASTSRRLLAESLLANSTRPSYMIARRQRGMCLVRGWRNETQQGPRTS